MDQQQFHSLQLHVDKLSFHLLDVLNPNHHKLLHEHISNDLEQYVQPNRLDLLKKNIYKKFLFTSSANRCFPLTTIFPLFGVEITVPSLITVDVSLLESDIVEFFDLCTVVRWLFEDFDDVEDNFA